MFDAFEVTFDNSDMPMLVVAESIKKAIDTIDDHWRIVSITRLPKYTGNILVQVD